MNNNTNSANNLVTKEGKKQLEKELKELINHKRPQIIKQIQIARELGDISENAEYDAAKNAQAQIESRIREIQNILSNIKIINKKNIPIEYTNTNLNIISIGSTVTIKDYSDQKIYTYKIVGSVEADPSVNKISNVCALAKSIIGKTVDNEVIVNSPNQAYKIKILDVKNSD